MNLARKRLSEVMLTAALPLLRALGMQTLFAETITQHFATQSGSYGEQPADSRVDFPIHGYNCTSAPPCKQSWQNEILHKEVVSFPGLPVVRIGQITQPLWDLHVGVFNEGPGQQKMDCSHYCYTPVLAEAFAHEIALHLPEAMNIKQVAAL